MAINTSTHLVHENRLARCIAQFWLENPWRELTAGKNILPKFGLKILGGHELLWGWLLGVYHAPDKDLLDWANAALENTPCKLRSKIPYSVQTCWCMKVIRGIDLSSKDENGFEEEFEGSDEACDEFEGSV